MSNDNKNFVLFAVFAVLILFGWPIVQGKFFPTANPPVTKVVDGKSKPLPQPNADPAADSPAALRDLKSVLGDSQRVAIDTPTLKGSINLKGARIDDLILVEIRRDGREELAADPPADAFGRAGRLFRRLFVGQQRPEPARRRHRVEGDRHRPVARQAGHARRRQCRRPALPHRAVGRRRLHVHVKQTVANAGQAPVPVAAYGYVSRVGHSKDPDSWTMHTGPIAVPMAARPTTTSTSRTSTKHARKFASTGGWLGFTDKYWLTALVPDQGQAVEAQFRAGANKAYQADYATAPKLVAPGQALTHTSRFFAGAKEVAVLQRYQNAGKVPLFDKAIDWGWFEIFEKPIFLVLDWLFRMIGNFGVAIICLTFLVRGLMFPIAQRQFASMAAMRAVQPKMKAIQERYKDDKPRQQQEIMALYKAEKVNPLAGCLPTLLQIPVFYALYKVLMLTIEMRHQPFIAVDQGSVRARSR